MACYHPIQAWRGKDVGASGKRPLVFEPAYALDPTDYLHIPCGQCIGCRLKRSCDWAIRCCHEASLHKRNCFLTLTYNDDNLPEYGALRFDDFQKFMKRLRKKIWPSTVRYFHCGEYGDKTDRPHYHALIFGYDFPDKVLLKKSRRGDCYFTSQTLTDLWGLGHCLIGSVSFESAAYVARYIVKKQTGDSSFEHYAVIDHSTGEILAVRPKEYVTMSRRPGIGKDWYDKFSSDVYPRDFVVLNGRKMRPPKFYDKLFDIDSPEEFEALVDDRCLTAVKHVCNNTRERLTVRESVQTAALAQSVRSL